MKGKKLKIPNIISSMSNDIHSCDIGVQPKLIKKKKERKKPHPKMKDLFYMKNESKKNIEKKRSYTKSKRKKPQMVKLLESMKAVDISVNKQARKRKHSEFLKKLM